MFYFIIERGKKVIEQKVTQNLSHLQIDQSTEAGKRQKRIFGNEYDKFLQTVDPIDESIDECVYKYWLEADSFPILKELALKTCGIPTSSTDCERLFSIAKYIIGMNRYSMPKEKMEMSTLLYANYQITKESI